MNIKNKVVVITGGASGLGKACVEYFLANGAKIAIFDMKPGDNIDLGQKDAQKSVGFYKVDVTSESAVASAIASVEQDLGEIRACLNCAGIVPGGKTVGRNGALDLGLFRKVIDVNLIGTFNVLRLVAEHMLKLDTVDQDGARGVIINTASVAAYEGQIGQAAYSASKGGVAAMTLPIARDLGPNGVRVNTIAPGVFATPMMSAMSDEVRKPLEQAVQFPKRLGAPEEFAKLAAHMIENDYFNGEVVRLDGGIRMAPR